MYNEIIKNIIKVFNNKDNKNDNNYNYKNKKPILLWIYLKVIY